jgi:glucose dehydrogenase
MRNLLLTTCFGAVAALAAGAAQANDELIRMSQNPKDWVMPTGDYANQRYSQLKQITADNVGKLQVAWTFSTGVCAATKGGPARSSATSCTCMGRSRTRSTRLDLKNEGQDPLEIRAQAGSERHPVMCCDTVNRGLSYADGKIFLHQADTTLVALDAKDGKVVWQAKNGDPSKGETGTSAPMVIKDKVLIGISGGEFGVDCHVTAYDLKSGRQVWRGHSQGPDDHLLVDP